MSQLVSGRLCVELEEKDWVAGRASKTSEEVSGECANERVGERMCRIRNVLSN